MQNDKAKFNNNTACLCEGAMRPKQSPTTTVFTTGDCHAYARNDMWVFCILN
jgi:hypothetical protein